MIKRIAVLLLMVIPLQAMLYRTTSRAARVKPVQSNASVKYQKAAATQKFLQRAQIHQQSAPVEQKDGKSQGLTVHKNIVNEENKRFMFDRSSMWAKGSWGALLTALGLGWLWYNIPDEEKAKEEAEALLKISRLSSADPLDRFAKFIKKYGEGPIAEQLFQHMIQDDAILSSMNMSVYAQKPIPSSVIPFIKRNYYTLALGEDGSAVLAYVMRSDKTFKKEITAYAIRDFEKLCQNAQSESFFVQLMVNNPEAVDGFIKKAEGHVEELVSTKVGKQLIDTSLVTHSKDLAKERALLLVDPFKKFELSAFNTCMKTIKDDLLIDEKIENTYKDHDLPSLLKKVVYQKHCQNCVKDDLSDASVSLKNLILNVNYFAATHKNIMDHYIVPDSGLSHMVIDALDKEDRYKDDYYFFYHGQPSRLGFQQRLFSWLVTQRDDIDLPIIYPIPQTKEEHIRDEATIGKKKRSMYDTEGRTYNLYAGLDLFSNKYPLKFAAFDLSALGSMPSVTTEQACNNAQREGVYKEFKPELDALENEYTKLNKKGQLLQFRIRKDRLEEHAFASGDNAGSSRIKGRGTVSDLRTIVDVFYDTPEKVLDADVFSVGISIGSNLYTPNSGIECSIINSVDPTEWAAYEKKEKALRNKIEQYMNPKKPEKQKSFMDFFR